MLFHSLATRYTFSVICGKYNTFFMYQNTFAKFSHQAFFVIKRTYLVRLHEEGFLVLSSHPRTSVHCIIYLKQVLEKLGREVSLVGKNINKWKVE